MSAKITALIAKTETALIAAEAKATELTLKLEGLKAELAAITATQNVTVGEFVIIAVGRGDTRRDVEAVVRAVKDKAEAEGVKIVKVEYTGAFTPGFEGVIKFTPGAFSNEFAVIESTSIKSVVTPVTEPVADDIDALIAQAESEPVVDGGVDGLGFHSA